MSVAGIAVLLIALAVCIKILKKLMHWAIVGVAILVAASILHGATIGAPEPELAAAGSNPNPAGQLVRQGVRLGAVAVHEMADVGRRALPVIRDASESVGQEIAPMFDNSPPALQRPIR